MRKTLFKHSLYTQQISQPFFISAVAASCDLYIIKVMFTKENVKVIINFTIKYLQINVTIIMIGGEVFFLYTSIFKPYVKKI